MGLIEPDRCFKLHIDATRDELVDFVASKLTEEQATTWRAHASTDFVVAKDQARRTFGIIVNPSRARKRP